MLPNNFCKKTKKKTHNVIFKFVYLSDGLRFLKFPKAEMKLYSSTLEGSKVFQNRFNRSDFIHFLKLSKFLGPPWICVQFDSERGKKKTDFENGFFEKSF